MSYYFSKTIGLSFDNAIARTKDELQKQGFGVLTEIDVKATFKKKLDIDFRNYTILGACNPNFAHQALENERMIGAMLPCNIIVQDGEDGGTQVAAVDPIASMQAVDNPNLGQIAEQVRSKLRAVIENL